MKANDKIERELSSSEIFWGLLLKWRKIVCLLIFFSFMVGSLKYIKDLNRYNLEKSAIVVDGQELVDKNMLQLTSKEKQEIEDLNTIQNLLEQNQEYVINSKLMNVNPYEENAAVIEYYINTNYTFNYIEDNKENYAAEVVMAYCNFATSGHLAEQIIQESNMNIEEKYITELISASYNSKNIFQIIIIYDDIEELNTIVESVKTGINEKFEFLNESIGSHTLTKLSERIESRTDFQLAELQKSQQDRMISLKNQISTLRSTMTQKQLEILEINSAMLKKEMGNITKEIIQPIEPKINSRYIIIGAIFGVFLAFIWIVLELLFTVKLLNIKELKTIYGLRIFGEITNNVNENKFLSFVDNFILKLKERNKKQMTYDQQQYILCSNLEITCKKEKIKSIYLTGSEIDKLDKKIIQRIVKELEGSNIKVCQGSNIIYDARSLKQMVEIGNVIFVEQAGVSLYQEITNELRIANEQYINILGVIAIN